MIQNSKVLTQEANPISLISTRPTTTLEDYPTITEREVPVSTIEQIWISQVDEKSRVGRTTPGLVNILVKIAKWLNRLGSGRINESYLESRHNVYQYPRIRGIGL